MALNLLGVRPDEVKASPKKIEMHQPDEASDKLRAPKTEVPKVILPAAQSSEENSTELDFSKRLRKKQRMIKVLIVLAVLIVAGAVAILAVIYILPRFTKPAQPVSAPIEDVVNSEPTAPEPIITVNSLPPSSGGVLPNTELQPLLGSLIRFRSGAEIYLVEDNGELRKVDVSTTVFENGQNVFQINPSLIYLIGEKWKTIRRGRDVTGQVDFDPRVLSQNELAPYIQ
jgi:hypothetical protein